jgi:hypothetical protein
MSGVKKATVTRSLNKTMGNVQRELEECAKRAEDVGNTGKKALDAKRKEAEKIKPHRELPPDLREYLKGDDKQWKGFLKRFDDSMRKAAELYGDSFGKLQEYDSKKKKSDKKIASIFAEVDSINRSMKGKDWYCDEEKKQADKLSSRADEVVSGLRADASLCTEALNLSQKSFAKYSEAENLAFLAQMEYDRLVDLANNRKEKERIKAENERNAKLMADDIRSLRNRIEARDYKKFSGGTYSDRERKLIDDFDALVSDGKYEQALKQGGDLKAKLENAAEAIENGQIAWETAKTAAEKALSDAKEESAGFDRDEIARYSGMSAGEVQAAFDEVNAAEAAIRAEDFAGAEASVANGMEKIRAIVETTAKNKEAAENRLEIARCIMQALYDANYDEPQAYLDDENDELSELHIVASAPGNVADMEMQVNLKGDVSFEVKNIPDGQEQLCEGAIKNLQEKLGNDGVVFNVTDWGRADPNRKSKAVKISKTVQQETAIQMQRSK